MTLFWILSAVLVIAAIAIIAPTLLRGRKLAANDREAQNIAIARERVAELGIELAERRISPEEHAKAKLELEQSLLQDIEGGNLDTVTAVNPKLGRLTLVGVAVLMPLLAIILYLQLGSPQLLESQAPVTSASMGDAPQHNASLEQLAMQLRQRLEQKNQDDAEGWYLLGRTYMTMRDYPSATEAYERAYKITKGKDPIVMLALADALAMLQQGHVTGRPAQLVEEALAADPTNTMAMWMSGIVAEEKGNYMQTLDIWKKLYPMLADEPGEQQQLAAEIKRVSAMAGVAPPKMIAQQSKSQSAASGNAKVSVKVRLSPALQKQVQQGDTVFIYAKAMNGPRFPLAAARRGANELPLELTLDESSAVMPNATLASFPTVKIGARVSHSGNAIAEKGDLIGEVENVQVGGEKTIEIVIDSVY